MKQLAMGALINLKHLGMVGLFLVPAALFLGMIHVLSMPIGGIALFSAIFMAAVSGFGCAIAVFHAASKLPACVHALTRKY